MKINTLSTTISTAVAATLLTFGASNLFAATALPLANVGDQSIDSPRFENVIWEEVRAEKLRHAYYLLDHADGDYKGHRAEAMHSVKKAADVAGVELKWHGGHGEEAQWNSDRRLREARDILTSLTTGGHGPEQEHLHRAIKALDKALATK